MGITALPNSVSATITSATGYAIPNLVNVGGANPIEYRRVIQSIVFYNLETTGDTEYRVMFGTRTVFQFTLKPKENFTIEGLKMTQLGDVAPATTNNDATKITCQVVTAGKTLGANVVISFANITIS
ncbi:hypothetical protein UFOVP453_56 [uncultured Caudovirales phage]|uniref:Uncharacterized protein n=1 Tax=uncultured Caudovirales phage TaxID=2100421 RepID=A0A6J5MM98_9CAUD|nr:hypothetical protein UFOVP453_56 [uncultured Caudovirales phage]